LTQEVAGRLIHNKALRISPQASAFRKLLRDIREVGRKLKVSHLLEAVVEALRVLHPLEQNYQSGKFSICR
jgi:hypothetical protein